MDKYDRLLDAVDNPGNYSDEELKDMLSDPDLQRAYNLLAASRSALTECHDVDIEDEWHSFVTKNIKHTASPNILRRIARRPVAAAIIAGVVSLATVAAGVTIIKSSAVTEKEEETVASVPASTSTETVGMERDTVVFTTDSVAVKVVTFKDESLAEILAAMERHYGVEIELKNPATSRLRLYYNWNTAMSLQETVEQLNNFEQISISLKNNKLTVD